MKDSEIPGIEKEPKFSHGYNLNDRPEGYVGKRRAVDRESYDKAGTDTYANLESLNPVVFLAIESTPGLGDVVIAASMSFKKAVLAAQEFSRKIDGEIFPERSYLPTAGPVHMRREDGSSSLYRIDPINLD